MIKRWLILIPLCLAGCLRDKVTTNVIPAPADTVWLPVPCDSVIYVVDPATDAFVQCVKAVLAGGGNNRSKIAGLETCAQVYGR